MNFFLLTPISIGIIKGDEIMVINGAIVSDLDMMYIESVLQVGNEEEKQIPFLNLETTYLTGGDVSVHDDEKQ